MDTLQPGIHTKRSIQRMDHNSERKQKPSLTENPEAYPMSFLLCHYNNMVDHPRLLRFSKSQSQGEWRY